jgi:hypothetical protein
MFNRKKLNEVECEEKYNVEVLNRFVALEDLDAEVEINSTWETVGENYELNKHTPWFDKRCSILLDKKKTKLQLLQGPSEINGDDLIKKEKS